MPRWTVYGPSGEVYYGVEAGTAEEATAKMQGGFKPSPLAPPKALPVGTQLPEMKGAEEQFKEAAGMTKEGKIPTPSILGAAVPAAVGMLVPPGRTVTRFLGNVLGNVGGAAGVEMLGEKLDKPEEERDYLSAGLRGAAKGVLPGVVQGTVGAIAGPTKATLNTQKSIQAAKGEEGLSPEVSKLLDPGKPKSFLERSMPAKMKKVAGDLLNDMEQEVSSELTAQGRNAFREPVLGNRGVLFPKASTTFEQMRDRIKTLRDIGNVPWSMDPLMRQQTYKQNLDTANQIERAMIQQMPADIAKKYLDATSQHRVNMDAIRWLVGLQEKNQVSGRVNPFTRPGLGEAEKALKSASPSQVIHGGVAAIEAGIGHGLPAMYHAAQAVKGAKMSPLIGKVAETAPTSFLGKRVNVPGAAAMLSGAGTAEAQRRALELLIDE